MAGASPPRHDGNDAFVRNGLLAAVQTLHVIYCVLRGERLVVGHRHPGVAISARATEGCGRWYRLTASHRGGAGAGDFQDTRHVEKSLARRSLARAVVCSLTHSLTSKHSLAVDSLTHSLQELSLIHI